MSSWCRLIAYCQRSTAARSSAPPKRDGAAGGARVVAAREGDISPERCGRWRLGSAGALLAGTALASIAQ